MGLTIGPLHVRRSAWIAAAPARVWQEFGSFERLHRWLGLGHTLHRLDPVVGGVARMSVEIDGERHHFGGTVLVVEPAHELSLTTQWEGTLATPSPRFWTIRLHALYEGTLVELFHHGFERPGDAPGAELEDYEAGWDNKHLIALRRIVEGPEPTR